MPSDQAYAAPGSVAPASVDVGHAPAHPARLTAWTTRDSELLLAVGLAGVAIALLATLPRAVLQDTWLALLAGRDVTHGGIPHHETLTAFAHGGSWIDQQWLSQLTMYWLYRAGGIALTGVANVALIVGALAGAVVAARRLGAGARSIIAVLPLAAANIVVATEVRTQAYACPLFVVMVYLLATDSRSPSRRVYWCLPLLVLWANLHGSASLGAGLVALRGLTLAWERRRLLVGQIRAWLRPAILALGAPLCLLLTPYGTSMASYYRATLLNGAFGKFISEWQPVTAAPVLAGLFFTLAAITVWSFGRHARQTTLWERCALLALAAAAITAIRNVEWFGFAALVLLPVSIDAAIRSRTGTHRSRPAINLALAGAAAALLVVALAGTLARGSSAFEGPYPARALTVVGSATSADPSLRIFADERFADWLLWRLTGLRGRVAYDARFELLSPRQFDGIARLKFQIGTNWKRAARGYRLLVLNRQATPDAVTAFEREPGGHVLYEDPSVVVILRSATQAV